MTIEEIDAELAKLRNENKDNFCGTFTIAESMRLHKMKEDLLREMSLKEGRQQNQQPQQPLENDSHV